MTRPFAIIYLLFFFIFCAGIASATTQFTEIGLWGGNCNSVAVSGNLAYVGAGNCLVIYDLTTPSSPTRLGYVSLPDEVSKIAISGRYAYVVCGWALTQIVDVNDPAKPAVVGTVGHISGPPYYGAPLDITGDTISDIAISGSTLYIACYYGVFQLDVSNPAQPMLVNYFNDGGWDYCSIACYDNYLLYSNGYLSVMDLSATYWEDVYLGSLPDVTANSLTVSGHYIYAACGYSGVKIIDLSDPANPILTATLDTPGSAQHVAISGSHAYVADGSSGMQVLDISDPAHPTTVAAYPTSSFANRLALLGNNVIIADSQRGFRIADISSPSSPHTAYIYDAGGITDLAVIGTTALVSNGPTWTSSPAGFYTLDLTDPTAPARMNWASAPKSGQLIVSGNRAYALSSYWDYPFNELDIYDVSYLSSPVLMSRFNLGTGIASIAVAGRYAYLGTNKMVSVVDCADASHPVTVGTIAVGDWNRALAVAGDQLYVGSYLGGLDILSIADPVHPVLLGSNMDCHPYSILPVNGKVYVNDGSLRVFDISDPAHPISTTVFPMGIGNMLLSGSVIYASNGDGVAALNLSNPAMPALVGQWQNTGGGAIVSVAGDIAYALSCGTLRVLRMEQATSSIIYGRVMNAMGDALYNAQVSAGGASALTDFDGYYVLGGLPAGECTVTVSCAGWATQTKTCILDTNHSVEVNITIPMGTIVGTVVDSLGNTVSGARLSLYDPYSDVGGDCLSQSAIETGTDGHFTIPGVYPGYWAVGAGKLGYDSEGNYVTVIGGQTTTCDIRIHLRGIISGHITDPRGAPIQGVTVSYTSEQGTYPIITYSANTASDGSYTLSNVPEEFHELKVYQNSQNVAARLVNVPGGLTTTCDFMLPDQMPVTQLGSCLLGGEPSGLCVVGAHAYVACGSLGLGIVDISNPDNLVLLGMCGIPGTAKDVTVAGHYAYVAAGPAGLQVIDVLDSTHPTLVGACATAGNATGVAVQDNYAYVADLTGSLFVISLQNPTEPMVVGQIKVSAKSVVVSGNSAYVSGSWGTSGMTSIVDISDPTRLRKKDAFYFNHLPDIAVSDEWAFAPASYSSFGVYTTSILSYSHCECSLDGTFGNTVFLADGRAYIADSTHGLCVVDVSDPTTPSLIGTSNYTAVDIAASGDYAYTTGSDGYLRVYDVLSPAVTGAAPNMGYNNGILNMTGIAGKGFKPGCGVKLTRPGQPDIVGSNIAMQPSQITCAFDLTGAMPGYWTVCVANPDGKIGKAAPTTFRIRVSNSAPKIGLRARDASALVTAAGARNHRFVVWGKVKTRSSTLIQIDDGSGKQIAITGTGLPVISVGSYISACGTLEPATNPPCLFCQPTDIVKYQ